jgi:hypothetical protein
MLILYQEFLKMKSTLISNGIEISVEVETNKINKDTLSRITEFFHSFLGAHPEVSGTSSGFVSLETNDTINHGGWKIPNSSSLSSSEFSESTMALEKASSALPLNHQLPQQPDVAFNHLKATGPLEIERDSVGHPWDSEIHTRTKSKNEDGTWKLKRGALKNEEETPPPPPIDSAAITPSSVDDKYKNLMALALKYVSEKILTNQQVVETLKLLGVNNFVDLKPRADLYDSVEIALKQLAEQQ